MPRMVCANVVLTPHRPIQELALQLERLESSRQLGDAAQRCAQAEQALERLKVEEQSVAQGLASAAAIGNAMAAAVAERLTRAEGERGRCGHRPPARRRPTRKARSEERSRDEASDAPVAHDEQPRRGPVAQRASSPPPSRKAAPSARPCAAAATRSDTDTSDGELRCSGSDGEMAFAGKLSRLQGYCAAVAAAGGRLGASFRSEGEISPGQVSFSEDASCAGNWW